MLSQLILLIVDRYSNGINHRITHRVSSIADRKSPIAYLTSNIQFSLALLAVTYYISAFNEMTHLYAKINKNLSGAL
jgi:hypothetical protein